MLACDPPPYPAIEARMNDARHWAVIETGANQRYVFSSNRRRQNIGASELIRRLGEEWVPESANRCGLTEEELVISSSGRALLLCTPDKARAVIREVTMRALQEAPGLQAWGTVCSVPVGEAPAASLDRVYREHAAARSLIPGPEVRDARLPILAADSFYGQPVASVESRNGAIERFGRRASSADAAALDARRRLARRLDDELRGSSEAGNAEIEHPASAALLDEASLRRGEDVVDDGRVAVVHADGNGIGALFMSLGSLPAEDFAPRTRDLSKALDAITWAALARAVDETHQALNPHLRESEPSSVDATSAQVDAMPPRTVTGWILPVLVGGDDLTVIVAGRAAYRFTVAFLRAFEAAAAANDTITGLLDDLRGTPGAPDRLTAAAGIAAVDSHHPFSHAYELSEELCNSAKRTVRALDKPRSALDVHVLFESSLRDLEQIREHLVLKRGDTRRQLWSGALVLADADAAELPARTLTTSSLDAMVAAMTSQGKDSPAVLTSGAAHRVRSALLEQPETLARELDAVIRNALDGDAVAALLDADGLRDPTKTDPVTLVTALDLVDLAEETIS